MVLLIVAQPGLVVGYAEFDADESRDRAEMLARTISTRLRRA